MPEKHSLARVLSSTGQTKILTVLSHVGELHLTEIAKQTDQSYSSTLRHLEDLSDAAIVVEHDYGRVRMFKLNLENPRAKFLRQLILEWDKIPYDSRSKNTLKQCESPNIGLGAGAMIKCAECGTESPLNTECEYCHKTFCEKHMPEHKAWEHRHESLAEDSSRLWKRRRESP